MKQLIVLIVLQVFVLYTRSQITSKIETYKLPGENEIENIVIVTMPFGKHNAISISGDTAEIRNAGEMMIDIICTDFPSTLSLTKLNTERIGEFYRLFPFIHPKQVLQTRVLRQKDGSKKPQAQEMFHGLVIKFRPRQTMETMVHDLAKLEEILKTKENQIVTSKISDMLPGKKNKIKEIESGSNVETTVLTNPDIEGNKILPSISGFGSLKEFKKEYGKDTSSFLVLTPEEALAKGFISTKEYRGGNGRTFKRAMGWRAQKIVAFRYHTERGVTDSGAVKTDIDPLTIDSTSLTDYAVQNNRPLPDSTLFKIFTRNKWRKINIVGDVTGSMYPYTAQLLLWLKLQSLDSLTAQYTFFNDGDDLPDKRKRIGKTGGIYSKDCSSFADVLALVTTTMMNGGGGDCPENNVEALIAAEKEFTGTKFHVLIADNWANVKDISLANQLKKPVRIVLCGVYDDMINPQYLDLARLTKGSVHLMENDLYNLAILHEGETISIGKRTFKLVNGQFIDITKNNGKRI